MSLIFAAIGIALIIYALRLNGLPIMTSVGMFAGCIFLVLAAVSIDAPRGSGGCWTDWDGRSNPTVCD